MRCYPCNEAKILPLLVIALRPVWNNRCHGSLETERTKCNVFVPERFHSSDIQVNIGTKYFQSVRHQTHIRLPAVKCGLRSNQKLYITFRWHIGSQ